MISFIDYFAQRTVTESTSLKEWLEDITPLNEAVNTTRYSVEVNFRSKIDEVKEAFAKICLGYVSAALKQDGYHIKQVFDDKPLRILVSTRNWDNGEWVGIISYNPNHEKGSFVMSKGFYNKDRKTVSIQSNHKTGDNAGDIVADLRNMMHSVKHQKDRHVEKLKPVPLKRGPKRK
jgi:hypothetical protein